MVCKIKLRQTIIHITICDATEADAKTRHELFILKKCSEKIIHSTLIFFLFFLAKSELFFLRHKNVCGCHKFSDRVANKNNEEKRFECDNMTEVPKCLSICYVHHILIKNRQNTETK